MDCMRDDSATFEDVFCLCGIALLGCAGRSMERKQKPVLVGSAITRKELLLSLSWRHLSQHPATVSALVYLRRMAICSERCSRALSGFAGVMFPREFNLASGAIFAECGVLGGAGRPVYGGIGTLLE